MAGQFSQAIRYSLAVVRAVLSRLESVTQEVTLTLSKRARTARQLTLSGQQLRMPVVSKQQRDLEVLLTQSPPLILVPVRLSSGLYSGAGILVPSTSQPLPSQVVVQ